MPYLSQLKNVALTLSLVLLLMASLLLIGWLPDKTTAIAVRSAQSREVSYMSVRSTHPNPARPFRSPLRTAQALTFTVNLTDDTDTVCTLLSCSLREAIKAANASPGSDLIAFNIPGTGTHTIAPTTDLPIISDPVIIDGRTQPGYADQPVIHLSGSLLGEGPDALHITAGNSTIRGLTINDFYGYGIYIEQQGGNVILSNIIGTDPSGTSQFGTMQAGVLIIGTSDNVIGGIGPGEGNVIAFNSDAGVAIVTAFGGDAPPITGTGNLIRGNAIYENAGLGIDLSDTFFTDGVTPNDEGDQDSGSNNLQNSPLISAVSGGISSVTISGMLSSTPNTTFLLDFYANSACDASGYGEGETYLGATTVTTDNSGEVTFTTTLTTAVPVGKLVTATATDPANNTSEFSQCGDGPAPDTTPPTFPNSPLIGPALGASYATPKPPKYEWKPATDLDDNNQSQPNICYILIVSGDETFVLPAPSSSGCNSIIFPVRAHRALITEQSIRTTATVYTPTADMPNGVYSWTVQAIDPSGNVSAMIPEQSFTIAVPEDSISIYLPIVIKE